MDNDDTHVLLSPLKQAQEKKGLSRPPPGPSALFHCARRGGERQCRLSAAMRSIKKPCRSGRLMLGDASRLRVCKDPRPAFKASRLLCAFRLRSRVYDTALSRYPLTLLLSPCYFVFRFLLYWLEFCEQVSSPHAVCGGYTV